MDIFPDVLRIEISGICNFRCIHCPTGNKPNHRGLLSRDKFEYILEQFKSNNFIPRVVVLYHGGEPLLNMNLEYYISTLKKTGVKKTVISTNASLLTEERSKSLIEAGLDEIKISFDGESAEENNIIRKNANFERDSQNLINLVKIKNNLRYANPVIRVQNVKISCKKELEMMYKRGTFVFDSLPCYLMDKFKDVICDIEYLSMPAIVWPGYEETDQFAITIFPSQNKNYCESVFETISVLSDGNVVPCCYDLEGKEIFGNIFENSIFDIWQNKKYSGFRDGIKKNRYASICKKCFVVNPSFLVKKK